MSQLIQNKRLPQSASNLAKVSGKWTALPLAIVLTIVPLTDCPLARAEDGGIANGSTAEGTSALASQTSGQYNTAMGLQALSGDTTGSSNVGLGVNTLYKNTSGSYNTATGLDALYSNTNGTYNTATGAYALYTNTTGQENTATGINALRKNNAGYANTATGVNTLYNNTSGNYNTANGPFALFSNTIGAANTAIGLGALYYNTRGDYNVAAGFDALYHNIDGYDNTALGIGALGGNTSGYGNMAIGAYSLNLATTGHDNIAVGNSAGYGVRAGSNNIHIGNQGADDSDTIRIGTSQTKTVIAGISGSDETNGGSASVKAVYVNGSGKLGTFTPPSSRRFKKEIKRMNNASEAILALKPVTFRYKQENQATPQFGLIAEEVAEINPDLIVRDAEGKPYTVRYEAVNAMLLNEFLKEHRKVQEQEATIARLTSADAEQSAAIARQQAQIKALAAELHKVVARAEMKASLPATRVAERGQ